MATKDTWLTPKWIIDALGPFDLDPCAPSENHWTAKTCWTAGGLSKPWFGRTWLNPPYSPMLPWIKLMADERGTALINPSIGASWFHENVFKHATAIFWVKGRIKFIDPDSMKEATSPRCDSCFVAYGIGDAVKLIQAEVAGFIRGKFTWLRQ